MKKLMAGLFVLLTLGALRNQRRPDYGAMRSRYAMRASPH